VVGDRHADEETLRLPHPRAAERAFVLAPWYDLESDAEIPGYGTVAELLEKASREGVVRRDDLVLEP
jgi:2-amino-4-hydroxy-6-hydroxymethyldihydropteridine diphosphokinase